MSAFDKEQAKKTDTLLHPSSGGEPPSVGRMIRSPVLTVSLLNERVRLLLERNFDLVWIRGEISNFRRPGSGHWYFTLKDDRAQVRCAMFVNRNRYCRMRPVDGTQVLLVGRVSLYEERGAFQVIVDRLETAGEGALRAAFEALKERLAAEGLFAAERKRSLPAFPKHLAVVSSLSGAALKDVLSVVRRRFPLLRVRVLPVAVQGAEAPGQIVEALARAAKWVPDLVLLTRGGGSLEDLAAFNSEAVARAIAACPVPTVSAVGHETDITIADFAADLRAPTPSTAAELITPDGPALAEELALAQQRLERIAATLLELSKHRLNGLQARLINPRHRLHQLMQRADDLDERLRRCLAARMAQSRIRLEGLRQRVWWRHPRPIMMECAATLRTLLQDAQRSLQARLRQNRQQVDSLVRTLEAVSPLSALARGYAIITRPGGGAITHSQQAAAGEAIEVNFHDGLIDAVAQGQRPLPQRWRTPEKDIQ